MIAHVYRDRSDWTTPPHKFEAGTPNIAGAVGMRAAADYLHALDMDAVQAHESLLARRALAQLSGVEGLRVLGPAAPEDRVGVIPFVVDGASAQDVATLLDAEGIAVRAGHHCAQLALDRFGLPATVRASFYLYNTEAEADRLAEGVSFAADLLRKDS